MNYEQFASRDYYIICEQTLPSSGSAEPAEADLAQWYGGERMGTQHWGVKLESPRQSDPRRGQNGGWRMTAQ